ncbi:DUF916 domain-containing protein [Candidatus Peregrinibacteria bacterium]|nr:DUF916 domain-containing protein [Candidatus Peregrinibacteria bacterium]
MQKKRIILAILISIPLITHAQDIDFTVQITNPNIEKPKVYVMEAKPGTQINEQITINNLEAKKNTFILNGADSTESIEGNIAYKPSNSEMTELGAWITVPSEVTIPAQSSKVIDFSVNIPDNTDYKDIKGAIAITKKVFHNENADIKFNYRIAQPIELKVTDDPQKIEKQFKTTPTLFFWITIAIFLGSIIYLVILQINAKKNKK